MQKKYECRHCSKEFGSKSSRDKHMQAKHKDEMTFTPEQKRKMGKWIAIAVIAAFGIWAIAGIYDGGNSGGPYTDSAVHWHADFQIFTCGQYHDYSHLGSTNTHVGNALLHTHGDNVIHVEGQVPSREYVTLGAFFDAIGVKFSNTTLLEYENGDECGEESGQVKLFVNGNENSQFRDYAVNDGDDIRISFEP